MEVKFDTREKFSVVTPIITDINDNDADYLSKIALEQLYSPVKNMIFNFSNIQSITKESAQIFAKLYEEFMNANASLVFCHLHTSVTSVLESEDLLDVLNITPTESEAWDIVQMEEMERELFDDDL